MEVAGGKVYHVFGTYREVDFPRRLVYTWDLEEAEDWIGETLVTVEFLPEGEATRCPNRSACQRPQQPARIDRRTTEVHGSGTTASRNCLYRIEPGGTMPSKKSVPVKPHRRSTPSSPAKPPYPKRGPKTVPGEAAQALAAEVKRVRRSGR